jgi:hypothetical protein|tara:strand:+ start:2182 stop:2409 length:228 start_codon:yes stop_codon:yes gene_type:complete
MSKITKEELKDLQEQMQKLGAIRNDIGVLSGQIAALNQMQIEQIGKQEESKKALEESYGKINIDLKDGSYKVIEE